MHFVRACVAATAVIVTAAPALAQERPTAEVAVGYTILRDHTAQQTSTWGWMVSPAVHLNRWFSVVADVGGNYKTVNGFSVSETAVLGGGRAGWSWSSGTLYFQFLAGVDRSNYDGDIFTGRALQTGIGLDLTLSDRWAFRAETGGRWQMLDGDTFPFWRGTFGAVYRFGG
ncbi:MAG: outer membrane beta-barrel protein [Acidobacteriota bacterium]